MAGIPRLPYVARALSKLFFPDYPIITGVTAVGVTRKIQVVGNSTFVVSLPKNWVRMFGLRQGDEVVIEPLADGSLRLFPFREGRGDHLVTEVTVRCGDDVTLVTRRIIAHYLAGANEIRVRLSDRGCSNLAEALVNVVRDKILGVEILDQTNDLITLYTVLDREFTDFEVVVRKLFKAVRFMAEALIAGLEEGNVTVLENVFRRDDLVDKLYLFILRYLTECLLTLKADMKFAPPETLHLLLASKSVERLADHVAAIALHALSIVRSGRAEILEPVMPLLRDIPSLLGKLSQAFINLSPADAEEVIIMAKEGKMREKRVRSKCLSEGTPPELSYMLESVRRIYAYAVDIAEAVIDVAAIRSLRLSASGEEAVK